VASASLAYQGLPVFWLPEMLTVRVTTLLAVCVMTFDRCSAKSGQCFYYARSRNAVGITTSYHFTLSVFVCLCVLSLAYTECSKKR